MSITHRMSSYIIIYIKCLLTKQCVRTNLCGHHHIASVSISIRRKYVGSCRAARLFNFYVNYIYLGSFDSLKCRRCSFKCCLLLVQIDVDVVVSPGSCLMHECLHLKHIRRITMFQGHTNNII